MGVDTGRLASNPRTAPLRTPLILGAACGQGAPDPGCADAPFTLHNMCPALAHRVEWQAPFRPEAATNPLRAVAEVSAQLAEATAAATAAGRRCVVLGGDHSCAVGTWSGVTAGLGGRPLGLVWIDAHMDSHVPETSPSGALHGMPLACLLGFGPPQLTAIKGPGPKLRPEHVALVGVRSYEREEAELLARLGVRVFFMEEVAKRGLATVVSEALGIAGTKTSGLGITVDLDAVDPEQAPGVGSPVPGGLDGRELVHALAEANRRSCLVAVELAEFNPHRDRQGRTAALMQELLQAALEEKEARYANAN